MIVNCGQGLTTRATNNGPPKNCYAFTVCEEEKLRKILKVNELIIIEEKLLVLLKGETCDCID